MEYGFEELTSAELKYNLIKQIAFKPPEEVEEIAVLLAVAGYLTRPSA